jgi:hypothetical protein
MNMNRKTDRSRPPVKCLVSRDGAVVASYGGGTNSTAMIIEWVGLGLRLDAVVFADTGAEKPETYSFVGLFSDWLVARGYPAVVIVQNNGMHGTLENECLTNGRLPSATFGYSSCSDKYKLRPFRKWLKASGLQNVTVLLGFDAGEPGRKSRALKYASGYDKVFPLIEWQWSRKRCIEAIDMAGLPRPGKSACFFCPNTKPHEILALQDKHPDLVERAIALEGNAELRSIKGLGRAWSWKDFVCADDAQQRMFGSVCMGQPCGCYDG